jgi:hypothetical protein
MFVPAQFFYATPLEVRRAGAHPRCPFRVVHLNANANFNLSHVVKALGLLCYYENDEECYQPDFNLCRTVILV